jgi:hypothetical protein
MLVMAWSDDRKEMARVLLAVRIHIQNLLERLGMHSKLEAATFAMQRSMELELTTGGLDN